MRDSKRSENGPFVCQAAFVWITTKNSLGDNGRSRETLHVRGKYFERKVLKRRALQVEDDPALQSRSVDYNTPSNYDALNKENSVALKPNSGVACAPSPSPYTINVEKHSCPHA